MSEGSLFNSGFLGAGFNWWVGQIADDATWRDNILPGKFESANQISGWGRRYKVRIIGLHDQGETEIASDQLPWAQVMYPVTAGGGQGASGQTPNLRQGNMVFGFFLDGQEQQVPVIMGVLGNNAQTQLSTKIGDGRVTNTQPGSLGTSGNAISASGDTDTNRKVPDDDKVSAKPAPAGTPPATPKPGVVLDRFGRDPSRPPTRAELNAAQSARAESDRLGETGIVREARIANATVAATRQEAESAASPASPAVPGATKESADAVHQQSAADVKRLDLYLKKTVMLSPCDLPGSAMKGMQTDIENLTKEIDKILQTASAYVDAVSEVTSQISGIVGEVNGIIGGIAGEVSGIVGQGSCPPDAAGAAIGVAEKIQALLERFAPKIAKYMKIIFNKILEYTSKKINAAIGPLADTMFPNQRFQFLDMKIEVNELIKCLFSKITGGLVGQILGALKDIVNKCDPSRGRSSGVTGSVTGSVTGGGSTGTAPYVPICSVEELTGNVIAANIGDIDKTVEDVTKFVETFLNDIQSGLSLVTGLTEVSTGGIAGQVGGLLGGLGGIKIPNINGSIATALSFENITLDLFGCDSKPNCAASDFYTLQEGAGAAEEAQLPRPAEVNEAAKDPGPVTPAVTKPFATPAKNTPDLKIGETNPQIQAAAAEERRLAVQSLNLF
jgi:hypothetical protein